MSLVLLLVLLQTAAAWFMVGFIWTMQVLHYPLFAQVGRDAFPAYEAEHNRRFFVLVGPGVLVVAVTTIFLFFVRPATLSLVAPIVAAILLLVIVVSTARFQAPAHGRLGKGFDSDVLRGLVRGNWVRTVAWTALGLLDLLMIGWLVT